MSEFNFVVLYSDLILRDLLNKIRVSKKKVGVLHRAIESSPLTDIGKDRYHFNFSQLEKEQSNLEGYTRMVLQLMLEADLYSCFLTDSRFRFRSSYVNELNLVFGNNYKLNFPK